MANELRELQLQGDSTVYKLNDARITSTAVDTATHILTMATNNGETSIAPITVANLASALGESFNATQITEGTINSTINGGIYFFMGTSSSAWETDDGFLIVIKKNSSMIAQFRLGMSNPQLKTRTTTDGGSTWSAWT